MKSKIVVAVLFLYYLGCTSYKSDRPTEQQEDQITNEVKIICDSIVARWQRLDVDGCFEYYSDYLVVVNGSLRLNYQEYKKGLAQYAPALDSTKWQTIREDVLVLTTDLALCTGVWRTEDFLKSRDKEIYNPVAYSLLFKKMSGQWKVIYSHASGNRVFQKASNK